MLNEEDAAVMMHDLTYNLAKTAYRLNQVATGEATAH
jgi:hypothetical protein